jgi:hypothetical protein
MPVEPTKRKSVYPSFARAQLERVAKVSFDDRDLEELSVILAEYMHGIASDFEPPKLWTRTREAPLSREMEEKRRQWLVQHVEKLWRARGGTGIGGYYDPAAGKHTGHLLDLLVELLDQAGASTKNRSRHTLYRVIKGRR